MLTARKIAQIGTFCRWWCGIGPAGAIGGAAVPYLARRRRRIGFSSRTLPTDGAEILRRWWLAGLVHATARCLAGMRKRCPVPSGYMCIYSVLLETATHLVLVFRFVLFFISANPPVLLPFFHPPINNRRTPCLRQHCRCQRCRQDHPGHWCRCRRSGEFH